MTRLEIRVEGSGVSIINDTNNLLQLDMKHMGVSTYEGPFLGVSIGVYTEAHHMWKSYLDLDPEP